MLKKHQQNSGKHVLVLYFHLSLICFLHDSCYMDRASLAAQMVKRLPTMWETQVRSLGWEYPLEKEIATHSSTLAWKILWLEEPGGLPSTGSQRVGHS